MACLFYLILPVYMATWGMLGKQYEMTMAHPCLHEKPHWMRFHIHNGLNYHDTTDSKFISTQQDSILFAIHSERFQESAGTETHLCRPRMGFVLGIMSEWTQAGAFIKPRPSLCSAAYLCLLHVMNNWTALVSHTVYPDSSRDTAFCNTLNMLYPSLVQISLKIKAKCTTVYLKLSVPLSKNNTYFCIMYL